jgi:hypothetical protein
MTNFLRLLPLVSLVSLPFLIACSSSSGGGAGGAAGGGSTGGSTSASTGASTSGAGGCLQPGDPRPTPPEQACAQVSDCTTPAPACWIMVAPDCNDGPIPTTITYSQPACTAGKCLWMTVDTDGC